MNQTKIKKIIDLIEQIYVFDEEGTNRIKQKLPYMKKEGLEKLIKTLEAGLNEQNKILQTWIEREPEFAKKLGHFVDKRSMELFKEHEEAEQKSAEDILTQIE